MRLRPIQQVLAVASLLLATACATSPRIDSAVDPAIDFSSYRTFGFFDKLGVDRDGYTSLITEPLKSATIRELEARGLTYTDSAPDLLINFSAKLESKLRVTQTPLTYGQHAWAGGYYGYRSGLYATYPLYQTEVREYPQGTLNIDIVDARQARLIWEGIAVGPPSRKRQSELAVQLDDTVTRVLSEFPLARIEP